jgi:hypothetical protein
VATIKTKTSEVSLAFGLLNISDFDNLTASDIDNLFEGTLSFEDFRRIVTEYQQVNGMYRRLYSVGERLKENFPLFEHLKRVRWLGPEQQAATTQAAIDLLAANTPISVKNESNVVANPSPHNLFNSIPRGTVPSKREQNWYQSVDPSGIQDLFSFIKYYAQTNLPNDFAEFDRTATNTIRKSLQRAIHNLERTGKMEFQRRYINLCHTVAQHSADLFTRNLNESLQSTLKNAVLENIVGKFFRISDGSYVLAGIDSGEEFACAIPDRTSWKRSWLIKGIIAAPDLQRRQSVVLFHITIENKLTHVTYDFRFHSEIRWSHGKFCGNPEGKLYKNFAWTQVPFFQTIV